MSFADRYCSTITAAIGHLESGKYPRYRDRVALQRAVFGLASLYARENGYGPIASLSRSAWQRLQRESPTERFRLMFERFYAAADLIAIVASSDPYSVSDDFIASLSRHSPYAKELIEVLKTVVDDAQGKASVAGR